MGTGDLATLRLVTVRMNRILVRIAILVAAIIVTVNLRCAAAWTGEATFGGAILAALCGWDGCCDRISWKPSAGFFGVDELQGCGILRSAGAILNVGGSVAVLPFLGMFEPMVGAVGVELMSGIDTPIKLARVLNLEPRTMLQEAILPSILRSVPAIGVATVLAFVVPADWRGSGMLTTVRAGVVANVVSFDMSAIAAFGRQPQLRRDS